MGKQSMMNGFTRSFRGLKHPVGVFLLTAMVVLGTWRVQAESGLDRSDGVVKKIELRSSSFGSETVFVHLDGFQIPKMFSLNGDNPRIVCDFSEFKMVPGLTARHEFSGRYLKTARLALHMSPSHKLRIVFDLVPDKVINVSPYFFQEESIFALTLSESGTNDP